MTDLEARFTQEMVDKCYRATGRETGYWAGYFLQILKKHGGVGAARLLLERGGISRGLAKLATFNRLDLSMQALVLDERFLPLFTAEERVIAVRQLEEARAAFGVPS